MIRFNRFFLLGLPVALFVAFFGVSGVNAQSNYPEFKLSENIYLEDNFGPAYGWPVCSERDVSLDWSELAFFDTNTLWNSQNSISQLEAKNSFLDTMDNDGTWFVTTTNSFGDGFRNQTINISWLNTSDTFTLGYDPSLLSYFFYIDYPNHRALFNTVQLQFSPAGNCVVQAVYNSSNAPRLSADPSQGDFSLFLFSGQYVVASELDGLVPGLPDSYNPPEPRPEYTDAPDIVVVQGLNHKVTFRDRTWFTFDDVERNTCKDGLTPMVGYSIFDSADNVINNGSFSPTVELVVDMPVLETGMNYRIVSSYYCLDAPGEPVFTGFSEVGFHVTANGIYVNDFMSLCMPDGLGSIDIEQCMDAISNIGNMLNLSVPIFTNEAWSYNSECRNLVVLGSWIHKPGVQVCPYFPSYVRSVVTPFVSFLFGLLMMRFITSRGGPGFNGQFCDTNNCICS